MIHEDITLDGKRFILQSNIAVKLVVGRCVLGQWLLAFVAVKFRVL